MTRAPSDVVVFSHLRWRFVRQRPQHLLSRCARDRSVLFWEEPIASPGEPRVELDETDDGVIVATPHLPDAASGELAHAALRTLLDDALAARGIAHPVLWYYTPMALPFTRHVRARAVVYDCMDELSLFKGAPPALTELEAQLFTRADVVFTGGHALYEHKRHRHPDMHPFPSSVEVPHFARARTLAPADAPADQRDLPRPRAGFFGVIDERMDLELIAGVADRRPGLQLVMLGPIAKIDQAALPRRPNLHWLGGRSYDQLPAYLAGWDVALLPFARNESTRFISPTKTPEYLAAGKPVVATSIRDVVTPYGELGLAQIADDADGFAAAIDRALAQDRAAHLAASDAFLADLSWDKTWSAMWRRVEIAIRRRAERTQPRVVARGVSNATRATPARRTSED
jgi:UDP-galactopyranose mutase